MLPNVVYSLLPSFKLQKILGGWKVLLGLSTSFLYIAKNVDLVHNSCDLPLFCNKCQKKNNGTAGFFFKKKEIPVKKRKKANI